MMDSTAMSTPVTRGELQDVLSQVKQEHQRDLRQAVAPLATKTELHEEIQAAIAPLATKAELQAAIAPLATKAELQAAKAELQAAIAPLATKAELEMWGGALVARIQQGEQRLGNVERVQDQLVGLFHQTQQQIQHTEQRLLAELARHASAIHEAVRTEIKAALEPLEAAVFGPKPGRPTRRRKH